MKDRERTTRVACRWDDQPGVDPGWYCEGWDSDDEFVFDSQKIWWPINVDDFSENQGRALKEALAEQFPHAEIAIEE